MSIDAAPGSGLSTFIAGLPKAELHVHHVGSASPRIVSELAGRHPDSPVPKDPEALARYFTFTDFAHVIEVYLATVDLVRTADDVRTLTYEVARDLCADLRIVIAEQPFEQEVEVGGARGDPGADVGEVVRGPGACCSRRQAA